MCPGSATGLEPEPHQLALLHLLAPLGIGERARLALEPFHPLPEAPRKALVGEGERLLRFLAEASGAA